MCPPPSSSHLILNCNRVGEAHSTCILIDMQGCSGLYFPPWSDVVPLEIRGGIMQRDGSITVSETLHRVNVRKSIRIGVFLSDDSGLDRFAFDFSWCMVWLQKSPSEDRTWFVLPGLPSQTPPPNGCRILFGSKGTAATASFLNVTTGEKLCCAADSTLPTDERSGGGCCWTEVMIPNVRASYAVACCGQHEAGNTQYFCHQQLYFTTNTQPIAGTSSGDSDSDVR